MTVKLVITSEDGEEYDAYVEYGGGLVYCGSLSQIGKDIVGTIQVPPRTPQVNTGVEESWSTRAARRALDSHRLVRTLDLLNILRGTVVDGEIFLEQAIQDLSKLALDMDQASVLLGQEE